MIKKYRKKPVVIEAVQWTGRNVDEIEDFVKDNIYGYGDNLVEYKPRECQYLSRLLYIKTLEGIMTASVNDYIIKGVDCEFYPCKPDIFEQTYDEVSNGKTE